MYTCTRIVSIFCWVVARVVPRLPRCYCRLLQSHKDAACPALDWRIHKRTISGEKCVLLFISQFFYSKSKCFTFKQNYSLSLDVKQVYQICMRRASPKKQSTLHYFLGLFKIFGPSWPIIITIYSDVLLLYSMSSTAGRMLCSLLYIWYMGLMYAHCKNNTNCNIKKKIFLCTYC